MYGWRRILAIGTVMWMMLALVIYYYVNGIFGARRIERATYRDVAMRAMLQTDSGRALYAERKETSEPVFGIIETGHGLPPVPPPRPAEGRR